MDCGSEEAEGGVRVLDLFCGAGGAAMGLHRAWPDAEIVGVDIKPQPRYPFTFVQGDAMTFPHIGYDFIWASPPCQKYSQGTHWVRGSAGKKTHPDLINELRRQLPDIPWVIENVPGAPLHDPIVLCGSMFGLKCEKGYLRRHRHFEATFSIKQLLCNHTGRTVSVCGHGAGGLWGFRKADAYEGRALLGIDWMNRDEIAQAIPPIYSEFIAKQLEATR